MGDRVGPFFLHRRSAEPVTREEMRRGCTATSILSFGCDGSGGGGVMHRDVLVAALFLKL